MAAFNLKKIKIRKFYLYILAFGLVGTFMLATSFGAQTDPRDKLPAVRSFGVYPGFGGKGVDAHEKIEKYMDRKIYTADANTDKNSWSSFDSSNFGNFENKSSLFVIRKDVRPALTVALNTDSERRLALTEAGRAKIRKGLLDTSKGLNDDHYIKLGEKLINSGQNKAILRLGSEGEIVHGPYSYRYGNEDAYIAAFRHVATLMRSLKGNDFLIDYMGNGGFNKVETSPRTGITQALGEAGYPGNEYVDIIGVDVYNRQNWSVVKAKLDFTQAMAKKYGKPMSIPEWGLWTSETGDDPQYIQNMYDWMNTTPDSGPGMLLYNAYFWGNKEANPDNAPKSKAKLKELFGNTSAKPPVISNTSNSTPSIPTPPTPTPPAPTPTPEPVPPASTINLPDVIIEAGSIKTIPANPVAGEEVKFSATIKNIGKGPTPEGIIHGIGFFVDGKNVAWSDTSKTSLKPGESRTLVTNGGRDGNATWTATAGSNTVEARWDDIRRMEESNRNNNTRSLTFTVAEQAPEPEPPTNELPDVTIEAGSIKINPVSPVAGDEVQFSATIKNNGNGPTPEGIIHGIGFFVDGKNVAWSDYSTNSLKPGESRTLTTNGGRDGNATWTATEGNITVEARWDDVKRIEETNENNNIIQSNFTVAAENTSPTPPPPPTDNEAPTLTITSPAANAVLSGTHVFEATAQDDIGVTKVEIFFNSSSQPAATDVVAPFRFSWNTARVADGPYTVKMRAYDASGKTTDKTVNITVENTVKIEQPAPTEPSTPSQPEQPTPSPTPTPAPAPTTTVQADVNQDGKIDIFDLALVLFNFNKPVSSENKGDVNNDGVINIFDLILILNEWSQ
jgi:hypothetical protein